MSKVNKLFNNEYKKCLEVVKDYVEQAKKDENFSKDVKEEAVIKEYMACLKFFDDHDLLYDAKDRLESFRKYMKQAFDMIENAKQFSKLDKEQQGVFALIEEMFENKSTLKFEELVKSIIRL